MILAKGDPTWWGSVQAWFIINGIPIEIIPIGLGVLVAVVLSRRRR